jgi:hypothetical protein
MMGWELDTPGALLAVISIFGFAFSALIFVIDARINRITREMKPNGGQSMRDAVDRIEKKIDGHIAWHLEDKE